MADMIARTTAKRPRTMRRLQALAIALARSSVVATARRRPIAA